MLRNRVTVVLSGAISPLASAIALTAARQDATLIIVCPNQKEVADLVLSLRAERREGFYHYCDCRGEAALKVAFAQIAQRYKRIDALIHVSDFWEERWDRTQHLKGVMHATKAVMSHMVRQQYGRIVFACALVTDLRALLPSHGRPAPDSPQGQYLAAKSALLSFVRAAAMDLAQWNISVNAVEPGLLATSTILQLATTLPNPQKPLIPAGRLARPEEAAHPVIFLASEGASYVTGQWLAASGGLSLHLGPGSGSPPIPHANAISAESDVAAAAGPPTPHAQKSQASVEGQRDSSASGSSGSGGSGSDGDGKEQERDGQKAAHPERSGRPTRSSGGSSSAVGSGEILS